MKISSLACCIFVWIFWMVIWQWLCFRWNWHLKSQNQGSLLLSWFRLMFLRKTGGFMSLYSTVTCPGYNALCNSRYNDEFNSICCYLIWCRYGNETVVENTERGWRDLIFHKIRAIFGFGLWYDRQERICFPSVTLSSIHISFLVSKSHEFYLMKWLVLLLFVNDDHDVEDNAC